MYRFSQRSRGRTRVYYSAKTLGCWNIATSLACLSLGTLLDQVRAIKRSLFRVRRSISVLASFDPYIQIFSSRLQKKQKKKKEVVRVRTKSDVVTALGIRQESDALVETSFVALFFLSQPPKRNLVFSSSRSLRYDYDLFSWLYFYFCSVFLFFLF